jgi:hypothetical protein
MSLAPLMALCRMSHTLPESRLDRRDTDDIEPQFFAANSNAPNSNARNSRSYLYYDARSVQLCINAFRLGTLVSLNALDSHFAITARESVQSSGDTTPHSPNTRMPS